jgi:hypothetical protein
MYCFIDRTKEARQSLTRTLHGTKIFKVFALLSECLFCFDVYQKIVILCDKEGVTMSYEERKILLLKSLVPFDNLGRVINSITVKSYAEIREKLSYDDFFWIVKELHQQFLIDAVIPDMELENNPEDPRNGTLQIRQEGIEYLKSH